MNSVYPLFKVEYVSGFAQPPWNPETPAVDLLQWWCDNSDLNVENPAALSYRPVLTYNGSTAGDLRPYQPGRCYVGDGAAFFIVDGTVVSNDGTANLVGQSGTATIPAGETVWNIQTDSGSLYKCDEGAGDTSYDSSGNGNHGTITNNYPGFHVTQDSYSFQNEVGYTDDTGGATGAYIPRNESIPAQDIFGNPLQYSGRAQGYGVLKNLPCAEFDGTAEFIQGEATDIIPATDVFTFACRCTISSTAVSTDTILGLGSTFNIYANRLDVLTLWAGSTVVCTGPDIRDDLPHTIIARKTTVQDYELWLDGVRVSTGTRGNSNNAEAYVIGGTSTGGLTLQGKLSDLRVYHRVLTDQEIEDYESDIPIDSTNLKLHTPLSENGGITVHDASGNNNHGQWQNYTLPTIWGTQGQYAYNQKNGFNRRLWFNGLDAELVVPDLAGATITGSSGTSTPTKASETLITFTEGTCSNLTFSDGRVYPLNDINPPALIQLRTFSNANPDRFTAVSTTPTTGDGPFWVAFLVSKTGNDGFFSKGETVWFEIQGSNLEFHAGGATVTIPFPTDGAYHMVFAWHDPVNDIIAVSIDDGPAQTAALVGGIPSNTDPYIFGDRSQLDRPFTGTLGYIYVGNSTDFAAAQEYIFNEGILKHPLQVPQADRDLHGMLHCWVGNETSGPMFDWIGDLTAEISSGDPGSTENRDLPLVADTSGNGNVGVLQGGYNWFDQPVASNPEVAPGQLFLPSMKDQIDWVDYENTGTGLPWADRLVPWPANYMYGDTTNGRHIATDDQFAKLTYDQGISKFLNYREALADSDLTNAKDYTK